MRNRFCTLAGLTEAPPSLYTPVMVSMNHTLSVEKLWRQMWEKREHWSEKESDNRSDSEQIFSISSPLNTWSRTVRKNPIIFSTMILTLAGLVIPTSKSTVWHHILCVEFCSNKENGNNLSFECFILTLQALNHTNLVFGRIFRMYRDQASERFHTQILEIRVVTHQEPRHMHSARLKQSLARIDNRGRANAFKNHGLIYITHSGKLVR